jgi:predicted phosphoribosyltransferase
MINGELGISTRKPRVDPVEAAALAIAKREVTEKLRGAGLKVPKKDERVAFANGDSFTMDELVARRLEMHGERINKEAAKHVAELEKRAKRLREESAQAQDKSLEALGL